LRSARLAFPTLCFALGWAVTNAGCIEPVPFACELDDQCGTSGVCEPDGYCSFGDDSCHMGRRYGEFAPPHLRDQCVGQASGPVTAFAAGGDHACALDQAGQVWCWGRNTYGALGNGGFVDSTVPVSIPGFQGVVEIAAGELHTCALDGTGAVWCWGGNEHGQLGDGSLQSLSEPTRVAGIEDAVGIAAGEQHSCARLGSGDVYCWGRNEYGQLGDGSLQSTAVPVRVANLSGSEQVFAAGEQSCARRNDGAVLCWGRNHYGQLGTGDYENRAEAVLIDSLASPVSLGLGVDHMCAVGADGNAQCVGRNDYSQLGDQGGPPDRPSFAPVRGLSQAVEITGGKRFTCARTRQGVVLCWGRGNRGELGYGGTQSQRRPDKPVKLQLSAVALRAGREFACGQTADGCLWCWGSDEFGQLGSGLGEGEQSIEPVPVRLSCW
jgi:alpha-tubulin suppressor-like RCC1 family protein